MRVRQLLELIRAFPNFVREFHGQHHDRAVVSWLIHLAYHLPLFAGVALSWFLNRDEPGFVPYKMVALALAVLVVLYVLMFTGEEGRIHFYLILLVPLTFLVWLKIAWPYLTAFLRSLALS